MWWRWLDGTAHILRWLIPRRLQVAICDRYDLLLGMTREDLQHG